MTHHHETVNIEQISETVIVPVTTAEAIGAAAFTKVTLEGNMIDGGSLRNAETGEALLDLDGTEELTDERDAA